MKEKTYVSMGIAGIVGIATGVVVLLVGLAAGIVMIINGVKLLDGRKDIMI